jgi:prevent-host-death family protein
MLQVNLYEAKARLSQLIQAALEGEEVVIARAGKPAVRLTPVDSANHRTTGFGMISLPSEAVDAAFTEAVESEVAALFLGESGERSR